jgi:undecaprenyl-diphosphatase
MVYNKSIMQWDLITNIILISSILTLAIFVILGVYQWATRKSLKKVDPELLWFPLPLVLAALTYLIFEIFPVNYRPNGSGESSFPSTHTMIVSTIFFVVMMILPRYVKNKAIRIVLDIIMLALIVLVSVGRVNANMHWIIDAIGGVAFAFAFSEIYYFAYKKFKKSRKDHHAKHLHADH